jgi:hypothetical protein
MNFSDALNAMKDGKKVTCKDWNIGNTIFMYIENDSFFMGRKNSIYSHPVGIVITYEHLLLSLLAEDWEIYDPKPEMDFIAAFEELKLGKKIRRSSWREGFFLIQNFGSILMENKNISNMGCRSDANLTGKDILANNWEVVD